MNTIKNVFRVAVAALMVCAAGTARAVATHYMSHAELVYSGGFIPTGGVLVFPDMTLADLEGCSYWGRIGGTSVTRVKTALSNAVKVFPVGATGNAIERYDFDLVTREGDTVKAVHIQLYNGEGGVYAKAVKAWYVKYKNASTASSGTPTVHYTVDDTTGELSWSGVTDNLAGLKFVCGDEVRRFSVTQFNAAYSALADKLRPMAYSLGSQHG